MNKGNEPKIKKTINCNLFFFYSCFNIYFDLVFKINPLKPLGRYLIISITAHKIAIKPIVDL